LVLGAASLCNASSTTYDVDLTIGTGSVAGFIETDGTTGPYYQGAEIHLLDWDLVLTDGANTFDLLGPLSGSNSSANVEDLFGHGMLSATATQLLYDFGTGYGGFWIQDTTAGGPYGGPFLGFSDEGVPNIYGQDGEEFSTDGTHVQYSDLSGSQVIGTASSGPATPEPSTVALLGAGTALLALCKTERKHRAAR
jgi:hypothetical protein